MKLSLAIRDSEVVFSEKSNSVDFALENMEHLKVAELVDAMKAMEMEPGYLQYKTTETEKESTIKLRMSQRLGQMNIVSSPLDIVAMPALIYLTILAWIVIPA